MAEDTSIKYLDCIKETCILRLILWDSSKALKCFHSATLITYSEHEKSEATTAFWTISYISVFLNSKNIQTKLHFENLFLASVPSISETCQCH